MVAGQFTQTLQAVPALQYGNQLALGEPGGFS